MPGIILKYRSVKSRLHSLKIFIVISIMTFAGILSTTRSIAQATNVQDSLALIDIYNSTNGPGWINKTNWTDGPVVNWYGVTVMNGRVDDLSLDGNNLVGTLPASIGNLTAIEYIELGDNKISGTIPTTVGNLSILRSLVLGNNLLTGTIPASLGSIPTLSDIYVQHNQLTGTIPSAIGNATNLANIDLSYNQLTGTIPTSFNNLTNLFQLILSHNQLTGTIPSNIGNFLNLITIDLSVNKLTGPIPTNMANLLGLFTLRLDSNKFDFTGMEEVVAALAEVMVYAPQDTLLPIGFFNNSLAVSAGGTLANNTYYWYDNGLLVSFKTGDSTYFPTTCGPFSVLVQNSVAVDLTLRSQLLSFNVVDSVSVVASATNICVGTTVTFTATSLKSSKTATYQWRVNGVNVGVTTEQYLTSTLANNDVVTVIMTSGAPCVNPLTYTSDPITMTVRQRVKPSFTAIGPLCQYSTAPVLPLISNEGIAGTWQPATINTLTPGQSGYIFTATDTTCHRPDTLNITIVAQVIPTFNPIGPYCQNSVPVALPATSNEGIAGTWSPAAINTTTAGTFNFIFTPTAGQCAKSDTIPIVISPLVTPTFDAIGPLCQNSAAPALPVNSKEGIAGTWNPATISTAIVGTTNYTFTPTAVGTCYTTTTLSITISTLVVPTFDAIGPLCQNATAPQLPATSKEGIAGTWNPAVINTATVGVTNYIFTPTVVGACYLPATLSITITTQVTPTFDAIGPLCQNATAPALPVTSKEGIAGTWNPAVINTATVGVTNYIFTPTVVGACYLPATLSITIITQVTPTFDAIGPLCQNATAPALPATSKEGIAGTWNPAIISTVTAGTSNYIFTPTAVGACNAPGMLSITISTQVTPTFDPIGPLCQNATPPALPATSKEGIAGTWNPAAISTATIGTANYIFTPTAGGACSTPATLSITISTQVTPAFDAIGPLCQNATPPALPATSKEGIPGTWNPATINTATIGTSNYIFTPTAGGTCNLPGTLSITISTQIAPTFDAIGPLCQNATAPALPATSKEGVAGTWSPAAISTATVGTTNYVFTPAAGGACSTPATLSVTISTQVTPTFDVIGPLCQNATAPALPATSKEEIAGTWNPAVISTSTIGTTNYIFTPSGSGACSTPATLSVSISTQVAPTFDAIGPLCQNTTPPVLPATSKEGIAGTWNPAVINTATLGTDNYIFTPGAGGTCNAPATLSITISTQVTPTFSAIGPLCQNATAPALPATSKEGIAGSWSPATVNTSVVGSNDFVFTPSGSQCAATAKLTIVVSPLPVINAGPDKTINTGESVTLTAVITGVTTGDISSYLWSPSAGLSNPAIASPVAKPSVTTTYKLEVNSTAGCEGSGSVTVNVIKTNLPPIHVPNAFSPNGDGINDTWVIENISYYPGATLDLFNRYGQRLLHSDGYGKAWDGTYNGNPVPVATYYYVLDPKNNLPKMTGSVTVFR